MTGLVVCTFVVSTVVPLAGLEGNFVFSAFCGVYGNEPSGEFNAEPCGMPCRLGKGVVVPRPSPDIKVLLAKGDSGYVTDGNGFVASDEGIFRANDTLSSLMVSPFSPFIWKVKILWKRLLDKSSVNVVPEILGGSSSGVFENDRELENGFISAKNIRGNVLGLKRQEYKCALNSFKSFSVYLVRLDHLSELPQIDVGYESANENRSYFECIPPPWGLIGTTVAAIFLVAFGWISLRRHGSGWSIWIFVVGFLLWLFVVNGWINWRYRGISWFSF